MPRLKRFGILVFFIFIYSRFGGAFEILPRIDGEIYAIAYSPAASYAVSGGTDKTVKIWDTKSGRLVKILHGHESIVSSVAYSPDGRQIVSASGGGELKIWDTITGKETIALNGQGGWIWQARFSPDGKRVVSASADKSFMVWDAQSGKTLLVVPAHESAVRCVSYSPDGKYIVSASSDGEIKLWDGETGGELRRFDGVSGAVWVLAYSADGNFIVSGADDGILSVWDVETGALIHSQQTGGGAVYALAYSPNGEWIASGTADALVRVWDTQSFALSTSLSGHGAVVSGLDFSPDGRQLLSGSFDSFLKIWRLSDWSERLSFGGINLGVRSAAWSPLGGRFVSGGEGGLITVWDAEKRRQILTLSGHSAAVTQLAYSNDGATIASASVDATVRLWDARTGRETRILRGHTGSVNAVVFSPDAKRAVSASSDETLKIWDVESGKTLFSLTGGGALNCAAYSPDGRFVVSGDSGGSVTVWDARAKRSPLFTVRVHRGPVNSVAYSRDGRLIISASGDETAKILEADMGKELLTFGGHINGVLSAAFSPDGKRALSGDENYVVKEWDAKTGREIRTLGVFPGDVYTVSYSPEGGRMLAGSGGGIIRLWTADGREEAMFSRYADGEWVCVSPAGFYNSSPAGAENIMVRISGEEGERLYNLERFRSSLYRGVEGWGDPGGGLPYEGFLAGKSIFSPPELAISGSWEWGSIVERSAQLEFSVSHKNVPIDSVRVLLNGRLIASNDNSAFSSSRQLSKSAREIAIDNGARSRVYNFPVTLNAGGNLIEAYASNRYSESRDSVEFVLADAPSKERRQLPDLWVFSIGVGTYLSPSIPNLARAHFDAGDVMNVFRRQQGKLYRRVNSVLVSDGASVLPTWKNINARLNYFKQMSPQDTAVFFIAGRGFTGADGEFYFLPRDAVYKEGGDVDLSKAISQSKLFSMLDLPCQKIILLDLYSVDELEGGGGLPPVDYNGLVRSLQRGSAVVISSRGGIENTQVMAKDGRGVFAHALTRGLGGEADLIKDNFIGIDELAKYLSGVIPKLTSSMQHPITSVPNSFLFFKAARLR
ncbi:MAG: WD40 repeat domain-containing protein [Spirochaetaceae bacterium]|jgi:WD40 repeat protein|nr:WD40 repeat domain-containing protein [Spirochaetaceae bacterium]